MYGKKQYKEIGIVISKVARIGNYNDAQLNALTIEFIVYFKKLNPSFNEISFRAFIERNIKASLIKGVQ
jgi:hypothetical protein